MSCRPKPLHHCWLGGPHQGRHVELPKLELFRFGLLACLVSGLNTVALLVISLYLPLILFLAELMIILLRLILLRLFSMVLFTAPLQEVVEVFD